jgi:hypothetical protein
MRRIAELYRLAVVLGFAIAAAVLPAVATACSVGPSGG